MPRYAPPGVDDVAVVARGIVSRFTQKAVSDEQLIGTVRYLLYGQKDLWGCFGDGLITETELVNAMASELVRFGLGHEPLPHPKEQRPNDADMRALRTVLLSAPLSE